VIMVDELIGYGQAPKAGAERYFGNGKQSCHLTTDGDLEELHAFAERIGLRRSWFQQHKVMPHYDLTPNKRAQALRAGAVFVPAMDQARARVEANRRIEAEIAYHALTGE
jgi:hypothetical protein